MLSVNSFPDRPRAVGSTPGSEVPPHDPFTDPPLSIGAAAIRDAW